MLSTIIICFHIYQFVTRGVLDAYYKFLKNNAINYNNLFSYLSICNKKNVLKLPFKQQEDAHNFGSIFFSFYICIKANSTLIIQHILFNKLYLVGCKLVTKIV